MNATITYDPALAGQQYQGTPGAAYYLALPVDGGTQYQLADNARVTLTGHRCELGNTYLLTTGGQWIATFPDQYGDDQWAPLGITASVPAKSSAQAQRLVDTIIRNNRHILQQNLVCARFAHHLTQDERATLYGLQMRLAERDQALAEQGLVSGITTGTPTGYKELQPWLERFMASGGVGLVVSTATIVVACVVVASLATAAWFAFKAYAAQSDDDVRYSDQLTRTLASKLTDEEYRQLLDETRGIVTRARLKASFSSAGGLLKWALIGTAAWLVWDKFLKPQTPKGA